MLSYARGPEAEVLDLSLGELLRECATMDPQGLGLVSRHQGVRLTWAGLLEKVVRTHLQGDGNYTNDIHRLLTVELVYRLFIDERAQRDCEAPPVTETCFLG